jgi:hypothetical protein
MEMFLDRQVPADDPRLRRMYGYFESNLRDVIRAADRAGASVVLATVPINLRSCAPFGSLHRDGLSADALGGWSRHFEAGRAAQRVGDCRAAMGAYQDAAAIDDRWADLSFVMAQCTAALGEDARHLWARARDLDSLRFRADGRINRIVREVAANPRAQSVALMDLEDTISEAALGGTPGDDLFVDHVHLDFAANVIAARATFASLRPLLAGRAVPGAPARPGRARVARAPTPRLRRARGAADRVHDVPAEDAAAVRRPARPRRGDGEAPGAARRAPRRRADGDLARPRAGAARRRRGAARRRRARAAAGGALRAGWAGRACVRAGRASPAPGAVRRRPAGRVDRCAGACGSRLGGRRLSRHGCRRAADGPVWTRSSRSARS